MFQNRNERSCGKLRSISAAIYDPLTNHTALKSLSGTDILNLLAEHYSDPNAKDTTRGSQPP